MKIYKIIERWKNEYRLKVKANEEMNQGWLNKLNEGCSEDEKYKSFEDALENSCYTSNDKGFLVMEVVVNLDNETYYTEYYFDDYEYIDADLTDEEWEELLAYIDKYKDKVKDKSLKG